MESRKIRRKVLFENSKRKTRRKQLFENSQAENSSLSRTEDNLRKI